MLQDNRRNEAEQRRLQRLYQARWILAAGVVSCAMFAWLEPHRSILALGSFVVMVVAALFLPRRENLVRSRASRMARRQVWPDTSLKAMAEALGYPAYILDSNGVLRYANTPAENAFGFARVGDPIRYKFRRPEIIRLIDQALTSGKRMELEYQETVPQERWYAISVAPVPLASSSQGTQSSVSADQVSQGQAFYLLSFFDLTEAKRSEQMRSDFIANASHELRTPLASLRGFIETIQGPAKEDPVSIAKFLGLMLGQAERMSRLIDDLLSLSRIEMKSHVRPQAVVDMAEIVRQVSNMLEPLAGNLKVKIKTDIPDTPLPVRGDRDELIQVVENLVENACKYGQSGGRVELTVKQVAAPDASGAATVETTIRDYGPGIAAEHLPRLTERFYRVDVETSREKQGTGLGLAIVKHILNRHASRLIVASTPGKGASFAFRLPIDRANGGQ